MTIRVITQSNDEGSVEFVEFTEDFDSPVEDFLMPDCDLTGDNVIEADLPDCFPTESMLRKVL